MVIGIGDGAYIRTIDMAVLDGSTIARRTICRSYNGTDIRLSSDVVTIDGDILHQGVLTDYSEQTQIAVAELVDSQIADGLVVTIECATEFSNIILNISTDSSMRCRHSDVGSQLKGQTYSLMTAVDVGC